MRYGFQNTQPQAGQRPACPRLVERKTALRGQSIAFGRMSSNTVRKNTETDLNEKDPEVPYVKTERAIRDLVCSLMERQDRMNEEILRQVIDLQYRVDDLEESVPAKRKMKADDDSGVHG